MSASRLFLGLVAACALVSEANAAVLQVLSTGAVEPGIEAAATKFRAATGHELRITYRTAPQVAEALQKGERWDLVVATPETIESHTRSGLLIPGTVMLGRVGVGVAVRADAQRPDISSVEAFKQAVLGADALVFTRGSTGRYAERLLMDLGIYEQVRSRIVRTERGAEAMERIARGKGREIALGALTEIADHLDSGIALLGPLPPEIQHYTGYVIALMRNADNAQTAELFLKQLSTAASREDFRRAGIDPPEH